MNIIKIMQIYYLKYVWLQLEFSCCKHKRLLANSEELYVSLYTVRTNWGRDKEIERESELEGWATWGGLRMRWFSVSVAYNFFYFRDTKNRLKYFFIEYIVVCKRLCFCVIYWVIIVVLFCFWKILC